MSIHQLLNKTNILVALSILLSKTLYFETYGANILILVFIGLILLSKRELLQSKLSKTYFFYFVLILIWILLNPFAKLTSSIAIISTLLLGLIISQTMSLDEYAQKYISIITFLCAVSLLKYPIIGLGIKGGLFNPFHTLTNVNYSNYGLFGILEENTIFFNTLRNNSIWYEPGAFAVFINIALLLAFLLKIQLNKKYLILLIAMISTFSTAGIIAFAVISSFTYKSILKSKLSFVFIIITLFFSISKIDFANSVFNKLDTSNASTSSRIKDIRFNWNAFTRYPIFGVGYGNESILNELKKEIPFGTGSNTFGNFLMYLGFGSILIFFPLFTPPIKTGTKRSIQYQIAILLIFLSQGFQLILIFWILLGFSLKKFSLQSLKHKAIQ